MLRQTMYVAATVSSCLELSPYLQVAPYFAKVECFCFEEQRLLAGEEVDLPILFFIDRESLCPGKR